MKRILVVFCTVILLVSCGKNDENAINDEDVNVNVSKNTIEMKDESGTEVVVSTDASKSVPLPKGYPEAILPIYKNSMIQGASENADGSYVVMGYSNEPLTEIKDYYKKVLEKAQVTMVQDTEDMYLNMGELEGMTYMISITEGLEDLGYQYGFSITITKSMNLLDDTETPSEEGDGDSEEVVSLPGSFVLPETVEWPSDYPEEILPVYEAAYTEAKIAMKQGSQMMVAMMTEEAYSVMLNYYADLLEGGNDYSETDLDGTHMISSTIDGIMFTVLLIENDGSLGEDERFKTLIQIMY